MIEIKRYEPKYFEGVEKVCLETAGEEYKKIPDFTKLMYANYYTLYEIDNCFILLDDEKVVGYCIGALSNTEFKKKFKKNIFPLFNGNKEYLKMAKFSLFTGTIFSINHPSHFHIDILDGYTKKGYGKKLIMAQLENFKSKGSKGVHLGCDKNNINAQGFYKHLGFKALFDSKLGVILGKRLN